VTERNPHRNGKARNAASAPVEGGIDSRKITGRKNQFLPNATTDNAFCHENSPNATPIEWANAAALHSIAAAPRPQSSQTGAHLFIFDARASRGSAGEF
jgi:hypothetical protein